jgi:hypothetical protein
MADASRSCRILRRPPAPRCGCSAGPVVGRSHCPGSATRVRHLRPFTVGLRGFKLNPAVLTFVMGTLPARPKRRAHRRRERRVSKRLEAGTIDRLVAEYVAGTTAAELGRRYGLAKSSVLRSSEKLASGYDTRGSATLRQLS